MTLFLQKNHPHPHPPHSESKGPDLGLTHQPPWAFLFGGGGGVRGTRFPWTQAEVTRTYLGAVCPASARLHEAPQALAWRVDGAGGGAGAGAGARAGPGTAPHLVRRVRAALEGCDGCGRLVHALRRNKNKISIIVIRAVF